MKVTKTIDEYLKSYPANIQLLLIQMRSTIRNAAPEAIETIAYGIPTFKFNGNLVHFGAYKDHIGFYPTPRAIEVFKSEFSKYETSKGTVKFPIDEPLPLDLVTRVVEYRLKQNLK